MISGKQYVLTDNDLNELKKKIIIKESELQNGFYGNTPKITLNQWFDKWISVYKGNLKPTTKELYTRYWKNYVRESNIGNMQIDKIKKMHIIELYNELFEKKGLATSTVHTAHAMIYGCFEDLVQYGLLQVNPSVKAFSRIGKKESKKRESLTVRQQEKFIEYIASSTIYKVYQPMFAFFLGTGVRVGELMGLTWKDIDIFKGTASINHTMQYININGKMHFHVSTPKSESGIRDIPLVMDLRKQLAHQRDFDKATGITGNATIEGYTDFVFHTSKGMPYTIASINQIIARIVKNCNAQEIENAAKENREPELLPVFSPHILRHTFCTRFCENESNVKVIQEIMGHRDISTTMNIYSHVTREKSQEIMNDLGKKIKIC